MSLLDRVSADEYLEEAVKDDFYPYISRHGMSSDDLLSEYCRELVDLSRLNSLSDSGWETVMIFVI